MRQGYIDQARLMLRVKKSIAKAFPDLNVHESKTGGLTLKLVVRGPGVEVSST